MLLEVWLFVSRGERRELGRKRVVPGGSEWRPNEDWGNCSAQNKTWELSRLLCRSGCQHFDSHPLEKKAPAFPGSD